MSGTFASYPIQGGGGGGGSGTVTSVALSDGSSTPIYSIGGSPITTSGTLSFTLSTQTANLVFAGPRTGSAAEPTFRALVSGDLPSGTGTVTSVAVSGGTTGLTTSGGPITTSGTITFAGTLAIASGGTGHITAAAAYNALSPMTTTGDIEYEVSAGVAGRLAIGSTGNVLTVASGIPSWAAPATSGTVTSVAVSGGSTGLTTSGGPITTTGTITFAGTLAIGSGGTGQATAAAAFTALSPITTTGDIIYSSSGTTNSRLAIGSTGNVLTVAGGVPTWAAPATSGTVTSVAVSGGTTGLTTSGGPITSSGTITLAGTLAIANGGTGQTTASAAYNALSPMTTTGDIEYESGTNTAARLAIGTSGQVLTVSGGVPTWANASGGGGTSTPTANTVSEWDGSVNMSANNFIPAYTTTATSATPVTLTVTSTRLQYFTGSLNQTILLPIVSTLPAIGFSFEIVNLSSGKLTVQSSGANTIGSTIPINGGRQIYTCISLTGTTAASWSGSQYVVVVSGGVTSSHLPVFSDTSGYELTDSNYYVNSNTTTGVPIASSAAVYNGQSLLNVLTILQNYTTTATAAGTTTLTINSSQLQVFTGSSNQIVKLPSTGASSTGQGLYYEIWNTSTGILSIQTSTAAALLTMNPNTWAKLSVNSTADNTAARWNIYYSNANKTAQTQISRVRSNATSLTTATTVNVATTTSLTLPAGDWVIYGTVGFTAAASTTVTNLIAAVSKTSATLPATDMMAVPTAGEYTVEASLPTLVLGSDYTLSMQPVPVSLTTSTPYYLVAQGTFATSTLSVYGSMYAIPQ